MRKVISVFALALAFVAGMALSAQVRDWHELEEVHNRVLESIKDMERARSANHYDMQGHGAKAENHLREAERELSMAIEAAKRAR